MVEKMCSSFYSLPLPLLPRNTLLLLSPPHSAGALAHGCVAASNKGSTCFTRRSTGSLMLEAYWMFKRHL